jgi:demethylmenaquinone methyltransferase / 2-methoxy-6-polyprenyl-1,4-benzoquinol methylase
MVRDTLISADENRRMFDQIAGRYDLVNRMLSLGIDRRWRRRLIDLLEPKSGERFLDVGTGTGDVSLEITRKMPGAIVIGIDPAAEMLDVGREKIARANLVDSISFQVGDAMAPAFDDGSFSGVVSAFTIRNVEDRALAIKEMARVLQPGGRLVLLELTVPENILLRFFHRIYNNWIVPLIVFFLSHGAAYRYLIKSINDFPPPGKILEKFDEAGLTENKHIPLTGGIVSLFYGKAP